MRNAKPATFSLKDETKHLLFIQGAGQGAYDEDQELVANFREALGSGFEVHYPAMPDEENAPYVLWKQQIQTDLSSIQGPAILVGHSIGASVILKYFSEVEVKKPIVGIFLIATPFWGGKGWRYEGYEELMLPEMIDAWLPEGTAIFLYHCLDDEIVPFNHLALYAEVLPQATLRQFKKGGHQLNNDLSEVAKDVKTLRW